MLPRRHRIALYIRAWACAALSVLAVQSANAQSIRIPPGSITGMITAVGAKGDTVRVPQIVVNLWRTDVTTSALRDSACSSWQADTTSWMEAKQEMQSPSGMDLTGTVVGSNLQLLRALDASAHDTALAGADGTFQFANIPVGAYTLEAEIFANDRFLQWNRQVQVMPKAKTRADLGAALLGENQYCAVAGDSATVAVAEKIYNESELDAPITEISHPRLDPALEPIVQNGSFTLEVVIKEDGTPDLATVRILSSSGGLSIESARRLIAGSLFLPPKVRGHPVKAWFGIGFATVIVTH